MTIASFHHQTGLSILVREPRAKTDRDASWYERLTEQISGYGHEIRTTGGYWSARVAISDRQERLEEWVQNGLGREVVVHDDALDPVWEGFVNKISVSLGELAFEIGPLMDVGNRVFVVYSTVDNSVSPPVVGVRAVTAVANDTDSQALYGIIEKAFSTAGSTATKAEQNRDSRLAEIAYPKTSIDINLGAGGRQSMTLDCLGYWHWFKTWTYSQTASTGEYDLDTKITDVISDDPNGIFSADFSQIEANTFQVTRYENKQRTAEAILKGLVAIGDANDNRYLIGVYNERQVSYQEVENVIGYQKRITSNEDFTDPPGQTIVLPWNVLPGKWVFIPDFLGDEGPPTTRADLNRDPRTGLIEVSSLTAPRGVRVSAGKVSQLDQSLAKQGLGGLGG